MMLKYDRGMAEANAEIAGHLFAAAKAGYHRANILGEGDGTLAGVRGAGGEYCVTS
jgi:hypothetical protein